MVHYTSPYGLSCLGLLLAGGRQAAHGAERGGAQRPVKIGGIDHIDRQGEGRSVLQVGEAAGRAVGGDEARREIARAALLEHVLQAKPADVGGERRADTVGEKSEERRVGEEGVSKGKSRWAAYA